MTPDQEPGRHDPLLDVEDLKTYFYTYEGTVRALEGVSFQIKPGETFGLVGESGCGKSVTALSAMGLVPSPPGKVEGGTIRLRGQDLLELPEKRMRELRGNDIGMIFQEPMTALNPVYTVGDQIAEALVKHKAVDAKGKPSLLSVITGGARREAARDRAVAMLEEVGIPNPERIADQHPHELSGGMRQRVMIAMMMACEPHLLIADEPTTALDVTIQAQILDLMKDLQERTGMAIWLITHDMGVVAETCDRVAVMYAGYIVETGTVEEVFSNPRMPYTIGLLRSIPRVGVRTARLPIIPGNVPNLLHPPSGCRFHPRCPLATAVCRSKVPDLEEVSPGHKVACHHVDQTEGGELPEASGFEGGQGEVEADA